ncbi:disulfide bond formation protein B [Rhodopseudomonas sp.]|uniref:disulfide bond formation protein B n=1 Tax=Rhodopseudomonas sp. TaxID=1078 RepID=UPI0039C9DB9F
MNNLAADTGGKAAPARDAARGATIGVAAIGAATLAGAWFFQLVLAIVPCPLCLEQRYAYYLAIPLALILAVAAGRGAPQWLLAGGLAVLALLMLGNAGLGAYHAGVEWGFWPGPTDCSGPLVDFSRGGLLDQLDKVKVIRCDEVQWRFLGLSLAGYNVLISLAMAALAGRGAATAAKAI